VIPVIERDSVDGVPVLRSRAVAGRHVAALTFRVGRFDEALPDAGITHMVEHLTFAGHPEAEYEFNASVSGRFTTFYLETGNPADIATFMAAVCAGLAADHGAIIDRERRVLRTEAASRGDAGALGTCLAERYGARGPGLRNYQEFGLERLQWPDVAAWRERWFTAGNAVLWIAGDMPDGLRLPLADGPAMMEQLVVPLPVTLPGYVSVQARGGVGVSLVSDRSVAAHAAMDILQRRLTQELRHEHGITYNVGAAAEDLDRDHVHAYLAADALPEQTPMAAHVLLSAFEALADNGCGAAELDGYGRRMREAYEGPGAPVALLRRQAHAILSGRSVPSPEAALRRASELTGPDVATALQALHSSMIVAVPGTVPAVQGRMGQLPAWSAGTVSGTVHKPTDPASVRVLTTGHEGVMLTAGPGKHVTVRYADAAALIQWNDGQQALIGTDGFTVQVDPGEWRDGAAIAASITARVPATAIVRLDRPGPDRPRPRSAGEQPAGAAPAGSGPGTARARLTVRNRYVALACIAVLIAGGIVLVVTNSQSSGYTLTTAGSVLAVRLVMLSNRSRRR
jgi:predicted Zn-dependent peptidase